ncbi:MAG: DUF2851 family protein [Paludibacteraceae bacterium]|nr:DUF2851 family protein [Paludibacteraceae bacterium]
MTHQETTINKKSVPLHLTNNTYPAAHSWLTDNVVALAAEPPQSERLMHYLWFGRHFAPQLTTTTGKTVEVLSTGLPNTHAGPDVFNAMVKIGGLVWAGNVEFHVSASDWWRHRHHHDHAYDSVILHVVLHDDDTVRTAMGLEVEQMILPYSPQQEAHFTAMSNEPTTLRCGEHLRQLDHCRLTIALEQLMVRRLERKTADIDRLLGQTMNDWDEVFYVMLMRNFGFSTNADAFEALARSLPLKTILKHRDDIEMLEAFLFGQASMLHEPQDDYSRQLRRNYDFLRTKFSLVAVEASRFKHLRMRPGNFPEIRLAQMAQLLHAHDRLFSALLGAPDLKALYRLLDTTVSPYWLTHYRFGAESVSRNKRLSKTSMDNIVINTIVPFLICYGRHTRQEQLCERALELLTTLPAEKNSVVERFATLGIQPEHAGHSQALIELYRSCCEAGDCCRCPVTPKKQQPL